MLLIVVLLIAGQPAPLYYVSTAAGSPKACQELARSWIETELQEGLVLTSGRGGWLARWRCVPTGPGHDV